MKDCTCPICCHHATAVLLVWREFARSMTACYNLGVGALWAAPSPRLWSLLFVAESWTAAETVVAEFTVRMCTCLKYCALSDDDPFED